MKVLVAFVSQKGGVGKSTLVRSLATSASGAGVSVTVADLGFQQETTRRWSARRADYGVGSPIDVRTFGGISEAIAESSSDDKLVLIDTPPRANRSTLDIARRADLIIQPTGPGVDDLDPAILLFHEMTRSGISRDKLSIALSRVASRSEEHLARRYIQAAQYHVLPGAVLERTAYREAHNRGQSIAELDDIDEQTRALLHGLLGSITECVKARVNAGRSGQKKALRAG